MCIAVLFSGYTQVSSGTCQSNNRYDVPQADCETAASSLGVSFGTTVSFNDAPSGCFAFTNGAVWLNTYELSAVSCGTSGYNCLCGPLGTGRVSTCTTFWTEPLSATSPFHRLCCVAYVHRLENMFVANWHDDVHPHLVLASCDASGLLTNAETVGDCSEALSSGDSYNMVTYNITPLQPA